MNKLYSAGEDEDETFEPIESIKLEKPVLMTKNEEFDDLHHFKPFQSDILIDETFEPIKSIKLEKPVLELKNKIGNQNLNNKIIKELCPKCNGNLVNRENKVKQENYLVCKNYNNCKYYKNITNTITKSLPTKITAAKKESAINDLVKNLSKLKDVDKLSNFVNHTVKAKAELTNKQKVYIKNWIENNYEIFEWSDQFKQALKIINENSVEDNKKAKLKDAVKMFSVNIAKQKASIKAWDIVLKELQQKLYLYQKSRGSSHSKIGIMIN